MTAITALLMLTLTANAMSYNEAREQALFLTDKMAYELNLTEEQYDAAYEVNLDYLMSINSYNDLYGSYWTARNTDLSYILMDWQYRAFCAANYFYRPLYWTSGVWHFSIYARYPRRNYFYFGRPNIYVTYRGGHGWRHNGGRSWYRGRTFSHSGRGHGMRDRFDRGDFKRGHRDNFGNRRRDDNGYNGRGNRGNNNITWRKDNGSNFRPNRGNSGDRPTRSFGGQRSNRESSTRTTARPSTGDWGSSRKNTTEGTRSRTFTPSNSSKSRSIDRGSSAPSRSFGGGSSSRSSSSSRNNGGGHFGGRR